MTLPIRAATHRRHNRQMSVALYTYAEEQKKRNKKKEKIKIYYKKSCESAMNFIRSAFASHH